jgi:hypothetical protein
MSLLKQRGEANLPLVIASLITMSMAGAYYGMQNQQAQKDRLADAVISDFSRFQSAASRCYSDYRDWCSTELLESNYNAGDFSDSGGNSYSVTTNSDGTITITTDLLSEEAASIASSSLINGEATGSSVSSTMNPPSDNVLFDDVLARYENGMNEDAILLETSLDFDGYDLTNVKEVSQENIELESMNADSLEVGTINSVSDTLQIGENATFSGTSEGLALDTGTLEVNDVAIDGDMDMSDGTFSDVSSLSADTGNVTQLTASTASITTASGTNIIAETASGQTQNFTDGTGESLEVTTATVTNSADIETLIVEGTGSIATLSGNSLNYADGTIETLGFTSATGDTFTANDVASDETVAGALTASTGIISNLSGSSLAFNEGTIDTLNFTNATGGNITVTDTTSTEATATTLTADTGAIDEITGTSLDYTNSTISNLKFTTSTGSDTTTTTLNATNLSGEVATVSNQATFKNYSGDELNYSSATFDSALFVALDADSVKGASILVDDGSGTSTTAGSVSSSNAYITSLSSDEIDSDDVSATKASADSVTVSDELTAKTLKATTLKNTTLNTGTLKVNSSSTLGVASATSLDISGKLEATKFIATDANIDTLSGNTNATTANIDSANATTINGTNANFDEVEADTFVGGSATGSNFSSSSSSVNNNYALLTTYEEKIDNCINTTQYCIPETPSISLSCSGCTQASATSTFTATLTAKVTNCRQGCSVTWSKSSWLSTVSGCTTTSISAGGTATLSCQVRKTSASVGTTYTGSVSVTATNSHYTDRSTTASKSISFENTSSVTPEASVSCSGCTSSKQGSSFSATITGTLSNCVQGCSYTWTETGGASKSSCSNGTISATSNTYTVSCSISATLDAQESASGSVKLTVTNSTDSSESDTASTSYSWKNTSSAVDLGDWVSYNTTSFSDDDADYSYYYTVLRPTLDGETTPNWASSSNCPDCTLTFISAEVKQCYVYDSSSAYSDDGMGDCGYEAYEESGTTAGWYGTPQVASQSQAESGVDKGYVEIEFTWKVSSDALGQSETLSATVFSTSETEVAGNNGGSGGIIL